MKILHLLAANWDSVAVVAVVATFVVILIVKKQWGLLDTMLFALVTWAEREYGDRTGDLKLAAVIEKLHPHIPIIVEPFVSTATLEKVIIKALNKAKNRWDKNPALLSR